MNVAIAGGHGQIGLLLSRVLVERGHVVTGVIRNPDHADDVRAAGAEPALCDLEAADASELAGAIGDADAVVFAAGAGPGSGEARKETMDLGGAVKLIDAARQRGISRYVIVSSIGADPNARGGGFDAYRRAKGRADQALEQSGLAFTIVRPGMLTDDPGTGLIEAGDEQRKEVPRADVAATLATVLETPATIGLTFAVVSGETPIGEAVAALAGG